MAIQLGQAKQTARKIGRRFMWFILVGFLLFVAGYFIYRTYTISEGTRSGTLFKISKRGVVFKTYEGQLHLGGSTMMTEQSIWDFSVRNQAVYEEMQKFEGKPVRCHYKQLVDPFPWQGETEYIVYAVEAVQ